MKKEYKKVTGAGGVSIPVALRRELNIQSGDPMELEPKEDGSISIRPYTPRCIFCDDALEVRLYKGKGICPICIQVVNKMGGSADENK